MKIAIVKTAIVALIGCAIAAPVLAQEPAGCDKFKWPIEKERSLLTGKDIAKNRIRKRRRHCPPRRGNRYARAFRRGKASGSPGTGAAFAFVVCWLRPGSRAGA